jgi:tetratricopeptide (TPR) repeat protein
MAHAPGPARRFFISHSSKQKPVALAIKEALDARAWVDLHEIELGDVLLEEISEGIQAATDFVLLWSADSAASRWVKYELHMAFIRYLEDQAIALRVVRLDGTQVPLYLRPLLQARDTQDPVEIAEILLTRQALQRPLRSFLDRASEIEEAESALYGDRVGFVWYHGLAGVGKRSIAGEAMSRLMADTTRRVRVDVRPGTRFVELHLALAAATGVAVGDDPLSEREAKDATGGLIFELVSRGSVISFIDAQHWLDEDAKPGPVLQSLVEMLMAAGVTRVERLAIFASTRRPTLSEPERSASRVCRVRGLPIDFASALLREHQPNAEPNALRAMATQLDGHPLALQIASPGLVTGALPDWEGLRVQTAQAVLGGLSLSEATESLLEALAVVDGPLPGDALAGHLGLGDEDFREAVGAATSYSLIHEDAGFLHIHPLVREWYLRILRRRDDYVARVNDLANRSREVLRDAQVGSVPYVESLFTTFRLLSWSGRLEEAFELHASLFGSLMEVALQLYNERRYETALRYFEAVIDATEDNDRAQLYRARTLAQLGRTHEARGVLNDLETRRPNDYNIVRARGRVEFILRNWSQAVEHFAQARALRPRSVAVLRDLGQTYIRLGQWDAAREALEQARRLQDVDPFTAFYYAQVLEHFKEFAEARRVIQLAVRLDPGRSFFHHRLGRIALAENDREAARNEFQAAVRLDPKAHESVLSLASMSIDDGDLAAADEFLDQASRIRGVRPALLSTIRAKALLRRGDFVAAEEQIDAALSAEREAESVLLAIRIAVERYEAGQATLSSAQARIAPLVLEAERLGAGDEARSLEARLAS